MRTVRAFAVGVGLAVGIGGAGLARAQGPAEGFNPREFFESLDANGDKVIDKDEVPESGRAAFAKLIEHGDTNQNGKLESDEYRALLQNIQVMRAAGLGLAGAGGGGAGGGGGERLRAMDKNGDGKISREEFSGQPAMFARLDADKDGFITKEEIARMAGMGPANPERFKALDKNGDGKISREEFPGQPAVFDRLDADKDGFISKEEAAKFAGGGGGAGAPVAGERFKALDKNGDGKISKEEFPGRPAGFARLDANKDGFLSVAELRAGMIGAAAKAKTP